MVHLQAGARRLSEISKGDRQLCGTVSGADCRSGIAA